MSMAFDPNRWTHKTQQAFQAATSDATARNNPEVTPDHLLAALVAQEDGVVLGVLVTIPATPRMRSTGELATSSSITDAPAGVQPIGSRQPASARFNSRWKWMSGGSLRP